MSRPNEQDQLFYCNATEIDGERSRLIEFLVWARDLEQAAQLALEQLRQEWGTPDDPDDPDDPDAIQEDEDGIEFFGGAIIIDKGITVQPITPDQALLKFTRGDAPQWLRDKAYPRTGLA